jgi:hypothetical protein
MNCQKSYIVIRSPSIRFDFQITEGKPFERFSLIFHLQNNWNYCSNRLQNKFHNFEFICMAFYGVSMFPVNFVPTIKHGIFPINCRLSANYFFSVEHCCCFLRFGSFNPQNILDGKRYGIKKDGKKFSFLQK